MRKVVIALVLLCSFLASDTATAHTQRPAERRLSVLIQRVRERHGFVTLAHGTRLHRFGRRQVGRMIDCRCVKHAFPPLFCNAWGQAVGIGPTADILFRAFMDSPSHRRVLLDPRWRRIGVGARRFGGLLYVAVELC